MAEGEGTAARLSIELGRRHGRQWRAACAVDFGSHPDVPPWLMSEVLARMPFEAQYRLRFHGTPVVQTGTWLLEAHLPLWRGTPREEIGKLDPVPGTLYLDYRGERSSRNRKQTMVTFSWCVKRDPGESCPPLRNAVVLAIAEPDVLNTCFEQVQLLENTRFEASNHGPLLFRLTSPNIGSHLGAWNP